MDDWACRDDVPFKSCTRLDVRPLSAAACVSRLEQAGGRPVCVVQAGICTYKDDGVVWVQQDGMPLGYQRGKQVRPATWVVRLRLHVSA